MLIKKGFARKISIYFVGTLSANLINVILLPLYAYYVQTEDLGTYDYYITVAGVVTPIAYCAIWEAVLRYTINRNQDENERNEYKKAIVIFFFYISIVLSIICALFFFLLRDSAVVWISVTAIVHGAALVWQFSSRAEADNKGYAVAGVVGSCAYVFLVVLFVVLNQINYTTLTISHIISQILLIIVIETRIRLLRKSDSKFYGEKLRSMILFSLPLAINGISMWLYSGVNKILINKYIGANENGLYSFANKFSLLISLASTVISLAFVEEAYSFENIEEYSGKAPKMISSISQFYFSVISIVQPVIYILYNCLFKNTEYYASRDYVFLLLVTALFMALGNSFGSSIQVTMETVYIFLTSAIGAITSIIIAFLLIGEYQVYGVLFGGVLGYFITMMCRVVYAWKKTGMVINWTCNVILFGSSIVSYFALSKSSLRQQFIVLSCECLLVLVSYRNEIIEYLKRGVV